MANTENKTEKKLEKRECAHQYTFKKEYLYQWYTCFAAGAVIISIPIAILFIYMQRFYVEGMSGAVKG